MENLEVSVAVRHLYIYIYIYVCVCVVRQLRVKARPALADNFCGDKSHCERARAAT